MKYSEDECHGRKNKNYTEDFKKQIVALKQNGKSTADIAREYQIAKSTVVKWSNDYSKSGSFKAEDNRMLLGGCKYFCVF
ncbi:transposase [Haloimpatiens sp. FM7315]|uniref:transposase n=1 Tax=Haloimpatiens sp. FM7315 TaxID=3298609 RepID=UPI0035A373F7